jgi:hypothetical protein
MRKVPGLTRATPPPTGRTIAIIPVVVQRIFLLTVMENSSPEFKACWIACVYAVFPLAS